ncbi:hypothetical protein BG005_001023 [Podila minutissima]|nr:hypothetical protein BG005_001023 [Podila minutissima]
MTDIHLTLFCVVDGETPSSAFPIKIELTETVGHLKDLIKTKKTNDFSDVDADTLTLWRDSLAGSKKGSAITIKTLDDKTELEDPRALLSEWFLESPGRNTYIIVERPPSQALKRGREYELEDPQKLPRTSDWVKYDAKDGPVDLPPVLVSMLNSGYLTPAPRNEFKQQLDNMQVGQQITLPSIGQRPKHYGKGYQKMSFFITEQMVEMWSLLSSNSDGPIRRVLSGPMGVGKSYLALFLAAKSYSEGWLLLYVSDANALAKETSGAIANQICMRFLALNKDILTVDDFEKLLLGHQSDATEVLITAATRILGDLLQQPETKTLLVIDEHGALFEQDPPVPKTHVILNPLMQLAAWSETSRGARVVLTGTAHAKFEMRYVKSDMWHWREYVTPPSDTVFDKLLHMDAILSRAAIKDQVKEITNRVPRELVNMVAYVRESIPNAGQQSPAINPETVADRDVLSQMRALQEQRLRAFYREANTHFNCLNDVDRHWHRHALEDMFFDSANKGFDYQFMDLGLVYRIKVGGRTEYRPLCPAANNALLNIYKSMPLPRDTMAAITRGHPTGDQFEDALFTFLVRHSEVILDTTDLVGKQKVPVIIRSNSVKFLEDPPSSVENIEKAFERPTARQTHTFDNRNQIEKYLDGAFGGKHEAIIDQETRKFIVSRTDIISKDDQQVEDTRPVEDFRIVFIHGKLGKPNHIGKIKDFPDVLHISFDELQMKLLGDLVSQ